MAAPSVVSIWNRALQLLGCSFVQAITDTTKNGLACAACYEPIRDRLLEQHIWRFSIKLATLAADSPVPAWGRANSFTVPADFVMLAPDYEEDNSLELDYEVQDGKIFTDDAAPLYIRYVSLVTAPGTMTPSFRELLSHEMALAMCEALTQSNTKRAGLAREVDRMSAIARRANSRLTRPQNPPEDPYIAVRK